MILHKSTKTIVVSPDGDTDFFDFVAGVLQGNPSVLFISNKRTHYERQ